MHFVRSILVLAAALELAGCATMAGGLFAGRVRECSGFDAPLSTLAGSSRKELRVKVLARRVDVDFPFVVESDSEHLVLVGFTPLGTKSFTLVRRGTDVKVENLSGPALLVPPRNVMEDVLAMSMPSRCAVGNVPSTVSRAGDWQISDTCSRGRPVSRRIARPGELTEIEIEYAKNAVVIQQKRCRYNARYILK